MPLFFLIILLLAPFADIYLAARWLFDSPAAAGLYFAAAAVGGALLMKFAKIGVGEATRLLLAGGSPPAGLGVFVKLWLVGALLFFPGYVSDGLAAVVLLFARFRAPPPAAVPPREDAVSEVVAEVVDEDERKRD